MNEWVVCGGREEVTSWKRNLWSCGTFGLVSLPSTLPVKVQGGQETGVVGIKVYICIEA